MSKALRNAVVGIGGTSLVLVLCGLIAVTGNIMWLLWGSMVSMFVGVPVYALFFAQPNGSNESIDHTTVWGSPDNPAYQTALLTQQIKEGQEK